MIPPHNSLVKYDNPVLVSTTSNRSGKGAKKKGQLPPVERQSTQTEDILNSILPPRCGACGGRKWSGATISWVCNDPLDIHHGFFCEPCSTFWFYVISRSMCCMLPCLCRMRRNYRSPVRASSRVDKIVVQNHQPE